MPNINNRAQTCAHVYPYMSLWFLWIACKILYFITFTPPARPPSPPPKYPTDISVFLSPGFFHLIPQFACSVLRKLLLRVIRQRCDNYSEYRIEKLLIAMIDPRKEIQHSRIQHLCIRTSSEGRRRYDQRDINFKPDPNRLFLTSSKIEQLKIYTSAERSSRYRKQNPVSRILRFRFIL
jgi:hypothetical protein